MVNLMAYRLPFENAPVDIRDAPFHETGNGSMRHCVDYAMPEGTPIVAVEDGWVVDCIGTFSETYDDPKHADKCNRISIQHENGETSVYVHLKKDSLTVRPHQKVKKGEVIALSGSTGYATYPHLHFGIYKDGRSIPYIHVNLGE